MNPVSQEVQGTTQTAAVGNSESLRLPPRKLLVSYAQNFEDVLLHRVFSNVEQGFYVDIGAFDPVTGSVTKIFYDRGWSGINIEPGSVFERLAADRPRDINLNIAVSDHQGVVDFVEDAKDLGASHIEGAAGIAPAGADGRRRSVPCERLDRILAEHAAGRLINFMKIDAEGSEYRIIKSLDWTKTRPQLLVVEAVAPWTNQIVSQEWESVLLSSGYKRAYFDGLNLFFVRDEDAELIKHFDRPVNALDWFEKYDPVKTKALADAKELNALDAQVTAAREQLSREKEELSREKERIEHIEKLTLHLNRVLARRRRRRPPRDSAEPRATPDTPSILDLEHVLEEIETTVSAAIRLERILVQISQIAATREAADERFDLATPHDGFGVPVSVDPDKLIQELEAIVATAIRYDRIVYDLRSPDGPRALRIVLPVARLIRGGWRIAGNKGAVTAAQFPATSPATGESRLHAVLRKPAHLLYRLVRVVVRPPALRFREFLLQPLNPTLEQVDAIARDIEAIRRTLANAEVEGTLSPELVKSIDALLLTITLSAQRS